MKEKISIITTKLNQHIVLSHILLSCLVCFLLEWLSRHSFVSAYYFLTEHTGPFLFNSYVIFVVFSLVFLVQRRTFLRMIIFAAFLTFGIANCVILFNRVTPFGFTDLNMVTDLLTMRNTGYFTAKQALLSLAAFLVYSLCMVWLYFHDRKQTPKYPLTLRALAVAWLFFTAPVITAGLVRINDKQ